MGFMFFSLDDLKKIPVRIYIEGFFPLYVGLLLFFSALDENGYFGITFRKWLSTFFVSFFLVVIVLFFVYKKVGLHDYRFKATIHVFIGAYCGAILGMLVARQEILSEVIAAFGTAEFMNRLVNALITYIVWATIPVTIFTAAIFNLFAVSDPYIKEFFQIKEKVERGDYSQQITNTKLLHDSTFGPLAQFLNQIIAASSLLIDNLATTSQVLIEAAEGFANISEQVKSASDVVSTTTETLSLGAQEQVSAMLRITDELESAAEIMKTITAEILKNSESATEIAQMTTILSINASLEAARSGEGASGFNVVAENIRQLANDVKETSTKIAKVAAQINQNFQTSFENVKDQIKTVSAIAEEHAASIEEIAASMEELSAEITNLATSAQALSQRAKKSKEVVTLVKTLK